MRVVCTEEFGEDCLTITLSVGREDVSVLHQSLLGACVCLAPKEEGEGRVVGMRVFV